MGSILFCNIFKIEVVGNVISGILAENQCVIIHVVIFSFRRYDETRSSSPRSAQAELSIDKKNKQIVLSFLRTKNHHTEQLSF